MKILRNLIIIMVLFLASNLTFATDSYDDLGNPNDPTINERANACFDGATLEGLCTSPLLWEAGWYLIRYEYGIFSREDVPWWVAWVLPPELVPEELADTKDVCVITINSFGSYLTSVLPPSIALGKIGYNNPVGSGALTYTWVQDGVAQLRGGGVIGGKYWYGTVATNGAWGSGVDASQCSLTPTEPAL